MIKHLRDLRKESATTNCHTSCMDLSIPPTFSVSRFVVDLRGAFSPFLPFSFSAFLRFSFPVSVLYSPVLARSYILMRKTSAIAAYHLLHKLSPWCLSIWSSSNMLWSALRSSARKSGTPSNAENREKCNAIIHAISPEEQFDSEDSCSQ